MIALKVLLNGDGVWQDLRHKVVTHLANDAPPVEVAVLEDALESGRPSVAIRINLPDNHVIIVETTARLFCSAGRTISARYPDLFKDS